MAHWENGVPPAAGVYAAGAEAALESVRRGARRLTVSEVEALLAQAQVYATLELAAATERARN